MMLKCLTIEDKSCNADDPGWVDTPQAVLGLVLTTMLLDVSAAEEVIKPMAPELCNHRSDHRSKVQQSEGSVAETVASRDDWRLYELRDSRDNANGPHGDPCHETKSGQQEIWSQKEAEQVLRDLPQSWTTSAVPHTSNTSQFVHSLEKRTASSLMLGLLPVKECLIAKKDDHEHREAIEASEDAKIITPVKLLRDERRDERSKIWSKQEAECPDVDLACALVEEEHVVNDRQTNDLRRSCEETLERSACGEASITTCAVCADANDECEELRPE